MRFNLSSNIGKMLTAALLASAVTGCSSDATRFGGLFASSDQMTTSSIPRRSVGGLDGDPVPRENVASGGQYQQDNGNRNAALNQQYPSAPARYNPSYSSARVASAPIAVQRSELAAPTTSSSPAPVARSAERQAAMAQPFPSTHQAPTREAAPRLAPDPMSTGTTPEKASGWSAMNAPSVTLRPGETTDTLSRRFGVPEKEILKANGLKSSASAAPGQTIIIPTYNGGSSSAKAASESADLSKGGKVPTPMKEPTQNAAVLPANGSARDKWQVGAEGANGKVAAGAGKGPVPTGGTYVVKSGDSLAKIAKATGAQIADLKEVNDIGKGGIHIGQTLKLPHGATAPVDQLKTASIAPEKVAAPSPKAPAAAPAPKVQTASVAPVKAQAAAASTQSVDDAEQKSDVASVAPESTGIGKYRWPVRGAVIAAYGANVEGSRNDGIDISVPQGTPIKAAENGVVIYAGNGLKELGNTVLLRHDDGTVTVYGHADALSVARGQKVQRGQTLATSGMSGNAKQPQLHFEVRKNASPVNPMTFLE